MSGREMSGGEVSEGKCPGRQFFGEGNARGELSGGELSVGGNCPGGTVRGGTVQGGIYRSPFNPTPIKINQQDNSNLLTRQKISVSACPCTDLKL